MTIRTQFLWRLRAWLAVGVVAALVAPAWGAIFTDIAGLSAQRAIERLAAKGIIPMSRDGRFNPSAAVSRGEFAVMLTTAMGWSGQGVSLPELKDAADIPKEMQPAVAVVTNLATATSRVEVRKGPLLYTLTANKTLYGPDDVVEFGLTVQNTSRESVKFEFATSKHFDYYIRDGAGNEVARWSYGRTFLPKPDEIPLVAGATFAYDPARWRQLDQNDKPVAPGRYELVAVQETKSDPTVLTLAFQKGLMPALADNTFRPRQDLARLELATVVVSAMGLAERLTALQVSDVGDVPAAWRGAVATAIEKRVVLATADGAFRPARPATRVDVATALDALMDAMQRYNFLKGTLKDPVAGNPPQIAIEDEKKAFRVYRVARSHAVYRNNREAELKDLRPGDALLFLNIGDVGDIVYLEATGP